jgi:hypothetical protein
MNLVYVYNKGYDDTLIKEDIAHNDLYFMCFMLLVYFLIREL